jgi:hypothetical protein
VHIGTGLKSVRTKGLNCKELMDPNKGCWSRNKMEQALMGSLCQYWPIEGTGINSRIRSRPSSSSSSWDELSSESARPGQVRVRSGQVRSGRA